MISILLVIPLQGDENNVHEYDMSVIPLLQDNCDQECDDPFLAQLFEAMQQKEDTAHDRLDVLISDIAAHKNDENRDNFLYTYVAPYYVSLLLLYTRFKEYIAYVFDINACKKEE